MYRNTCSSRTRLAFRKSVLVANLCLRLATRQDLTRCWVILRQKDVVAACCQTIPEDNLVRLGATDRQAVHPAIVEHVRGRALARRQAQRKLQ